MCISRGRLSQTRTRVCVVGWTSRGYRIAWFTGTTGTAVRSGFLSMSLAFALAASFPQSALSAGVAVASVLWMFLALSLEFSCSHGLPGSMWPVSPLAPLPSPYSVHSLLTATTTTNTATTATATSTLSQSLSLLLPTINNIHSSSFISSLYHCSCKLLPRLPSSTVFLSDHSSLSLFHSLFSLRHSTQCQCQASVSFQFSQQSTSSPGKAPAPVSSLSFFTSPLLSFFTPFTPANLWIACMDQIFAPDQLVIQLARVHCQVKECTWRAAPAAVAKKAAADTQRDKSSGCTCHGEPWEEWGAKWYVESELQYYPDSRGSPFALHFDCGCQVLLCDVHLHWSLFTSCVCWLLATVFAVHCSVFTLCAVCCSLALVLQVKRLALFSILWLLWCLCCEWVCLNVTVSEFSLHSVNVPVSLLKYCFCCVVDTSTAPVDTQGKCNHCRRRCCSSTGECKCECVAGECGIGCHATRQLAYPVSLLLIHLSFIQETSLSFSLALFLSTQITLRSYCQ